MVRPTGTFDRAEDLGRYTVQLPPKPTVTLPPSTTTGISRLPRFSSSMRCRPSSSSSTFTYSTGTLRSE